jgi:hypothetical protein
MHYIRFPRTHVFVESDHLRERKNRKAESPLILTRERWEREGINALVEGDAHGNGFGHHLSLTHSRKELTGLPPTFSSPLPSLNRPPETTTPARIPHPSLILRFRNAHAMPTTAPLYSTITVNAVVSEAYIVSRVMLVRPVRRLDCAREVVSAKLWKGETAEKNEGRKDARRGKLRAHSG